MFAGKTPDFLFSFCRLNFVSRVLKKLNAILTMCAMKLAANFEGCRSTSMIFLEFVALLI